jgi:hypothetical protein
MIKLGPIQLIDEQYGVQSLVKKTKYKPRDGDVFVLQPAGHPFIYGRVIDAYFPRRFATWESNYKETEVDEDDKESILICIYDFKTDQLAESLEQIEFTKLLCNEAYLVHEHEWHDGIFAHLGNVPISDAERKLLPNCFYWGQIEKYVDARGNVIDEPANAEACPDYLTFTSRFGIFGDVREALGDPVPEDEEDDDGW